MANCHVSDITPNPVEGMWLTRFSRAWKPLQGPVKSWPLAVCDPSTVRYKLDTLPSDVVFEEFFTENVQLHFSESQKWYYISEQQPHEVLIFKTVDPSFKQGLGKLRQ